MTIAPTIEHVDAIVVGASIRGLLAAHVLNELGLRAVVLERGRGVGGADSSFALPGGAIFDHGLHVLDYQRSAVATELFTKVLDGAVHRSTLRRGIVLRGHVLPYNPHPRELPAELRAMLPGDELTDDLGDALPTRARLARCYGAAFADLIFDEVLPSYPTENRHRAFGVDEARLLTNLYPWFFPQARRASGVGDGSRAFHDKLRRGEAQDVLYPRAGGFGGFAAALVRALDPRRVEVITQCSDLHVEVEAGAQRVAWVAAKGRRFAAPHCFWAAAWPALCKVLALPCQDVATDRVVVGSFRLDRPPHTAYHELLVGDPSLRLNRVSFPARFRHSDEPLVQVEFAVPVAETWPQAAADWLPRWVDDLRRLGVLDEAHRVEESDFRSFQMHFNAFGAEGEALVDADAGLLARDGNVHPIVPSMANLNLNTYVPQALAYVREVMAGAGGAP